MRKLTKKQRKRLVRKWRNRYSHTATKAERLWWLGASLVWHFSLLCMWSAATFWAVFGDAVESKYAQIFLWGVVYAAVVVAVDRFLKRKVR